MSTRKNCLVVIFVIILGFFAGNLVFPQLLGFKFIPEIPFKLGLDLQGGTHLIYEADLSGVEEEDHESSMQGLRDVIERRINLFGVQEPIVQIQEEANHYRLIIELAGIKDPAEAIKRIGETPYLEFKEQRDKEETERIIEEYGKIELEVDQDGQVVGEEALFLEIEDPYFKPTPLTGKYLKKAELGFDQTTRMPLVLLEFNDEGSKIFEELTEKNLGKFLAIYIDGVQVSSPVVQGVIGGGKAQISGKFNLEEARSLARNLNAGALPVPIEIISQQTVGPTLGAASLEKSLEAGFLGFLAIVIFLIVFYKFSGLLASIALIIYILLALVIFKMVPVTLTLAGIGGFILSVGMAVDANVLIFSRMKEELRQGKDLSQAVEDGFERAWPSIRDGNFTTLIVALILFTFGTSFIKGFALTLSLGLILSIFSAVVISKSFLRVFAGTILGKIKWLWN
jgi:preprotein translocase subunit SecD